MGFESGKTGGAPKRTGLVCPKCDQPVAVVEKRNPLTFKCPACGHEWSARP